MHEDMVNDGRIFPMSNNWLKVLLDQGKISDKEWFDGKDRKLEDSDLTDRLKSKDIVISIDIDYFENFPQEKIEEAMDQLVDFIRKHDADIKVISIALSPDYSIRLNPNDVAARLCEKLSTTFSPSTSYLSRITYLEECGVCLKAPVSIKDSIPETGLRTNS